MTADKHVPRPSTGPLVFDKDMPCLTCQKTPTLEYKVKRGNLQRLVYLCRTHSMELEALIAASYRRRKEVGQLVPLDQLAPSRASKARKGLG